MEFWFFLDIFILFMFCLSMCGNDEQNKMISSICILTLLFFALFRYEIGGDYGSYETMYFTVDIDDGLPYPEYSFKLISHVLRSLGFDYQMLFIVYSLIFFLFFWKGLKYHASNYCVVMGAIFIFAVESKFGGYLWSMGGIRAFAAVAIVFYASRYAVERKALKFAFWIIMASLFHLSAFISLIMYYIPQHAISKKKLLVIPVIGIFLGQIPIDEIFALFSEFVGGRGVSYILAGIQGTVTEGFGIFYMYMICIISVIFADLRNESNRYAVTMLICGLTIHFLFVKINVLSYRLPLYFYSFQYLALAYAIINIQLKKISRYVFVLLFGFFLMAVQFVYMYNDSTYHDADPRISAGNYHYKFNFNIFRE